MGQRQSVPPGPTGWPLFGSALSIVGNKRLPSLDGFRERYGDVFSIYLGSRLTVVICGYDALKLALVDMADVFYDRPVSHLHDAMTGGLGLLSTSGDFSKRHREAVTRLLFDPKFGRNYIEEQNRLGADLLIKQIKKQSGKHFEPEEVLLSCVSNMMCSVMLGSWHQDDDPKFQEFVENFSKHFKNMMYVAFTYFVPWSRYIPGDLVKYNASLASSKWLKNYFSEQIKENRGKGDADKFLSFAQAYLDDLKETESEMDSARKEEQCLSTILDLLGGGIATLVSQLHWLLLFLAHRPETQEKAYAEIQRVAGSRRVTPEDRQSMPYAEAVVREAIRIGSVVPTGVSHTASRACKFQGYDIPEGVIVMPYVASAQHDPSVFPEPQQFRPERFLDDAGNLKMPVKYNPFGMGPRNCIGQELALMVLLEFSNSLIRNFTFSLPKDTDITKYCMEITRKPAPYNLIATPRNDAP